MSDSEKIADFNLSETQVQAVLKNFDVQKHEMSSLMIRVMQLVTTREFYENKETISAIPDYGFRLHDLITALEMAENSRETIRKDVLKRLRPKGILGYTEPAPNSPHTHYYLSQEFREYIQDEEIEELLSAPDQAESEERIVDLPYHDEELNRASGDHTKLIAQGLRELVPRITENPVLVQEGLNKTEREDVQNKRLPINFADLNFELPVYPDAIVYDDQSEILYLFEAVTSLGPFTDRRIATILEALESADSSEGQSSFDAVFITLFPDERRYRNFLMDLGDRSYVWLSDHRDELRAHGKARIQEMDAGEKLAFRYRVTL